MKDSVLYAFIMDVSEGRTTYEFSPYHPLYKDLHSFPRNHAITFMEDYIEHNKCSFIPKLKFVKIIKSISVQYDLKQKTLFKAKVFVDECILKLEQLSITNTEEKLFNDEDYYNGFY